MENPVQFTWGEHSGCAPTSSFFLLPSLSLSICSLPCAPLQMFPGICHCFEPHISTLPVSSLWALCSLMFVTAYKNCSRWKELTAIGQDGGHQCVRWLLTLCTAAGSCGQAAGVLDEEHLSNLNCLYPDSTFSWFTPQSGTPTYHQVSQSIWSPFRCLKNTTETQRSHDQHHGSVFGVHIGSLTWTQVFAHWDIPIILSNLYGQDIWK